MDKKDLKIQALLERVSQLTAEYENKFADLRVEITFASQEIDSLKEKANVDVDEESADTTRAKD